MIPGPIPGDSVLTQLRNKSSTSPNGLDTLARKKSCGTFSIMTESVGDKKPKPKNPKGNDIRDFYNKMTPEERKAFYIQAEEKRRLRRERNTKVLNEARQKAKDILPELLAQELLMSNDQDYTPRGETLEKLRGLLDAGLTMEEMRKKHFHSMSDAGWEKLTKFLFKHHIHHAEDLGLDIITVRNRHRQILKTRIREIERDLKLLRKQEKIPPLGLRQMKAEAEAELMKLEMDVAKNLHGIGVVGDKAKAASIHVHLSTPRPSQKDITPAKASLADLVSGSSD